MNKTNWLSISWQKAKHSLSSIFGIRKQVEVLPENQFPYPIMERSNPIHSQATQPYSIYYEHRPLKIAFLVNPDDTHDWVNKIIKYNRSLWGGRFNPIFFTDGSTISDGWWSFLKSYDPDIIYSTLPLGDELKEKIHIFSTPLRVEVADNRHPSIYISDDPLSILPSKKVVSSLAHDFFDMESELVLFEISDETPTFIKDFITLNFGVYESVRQRPTDLKLAIESCKQRVYSVTDYASLNAALLSLADIRNRSVFPSQICSFPNHINDVEYNESLECFEVIVGNTSKEITYAWNRVLHLKHWQRERISQLWVPQELIQHTELKDGLTKFIARHATGIGNNPQQIKYTTFSLPDGKIDEILQHFDDLKYYRKTSQKLTDIPFPEYGKYNESFYMRRGMDFVRAHSNEEHLLLGEPDGIGEGGEHWITNLYIEYRPESFRSIRGIEHWWQLPKRNNILADLHFFNKQARVNEHGMFSVLMKRKTTFDQDQNTLIINLPTNNAIFGAIACGDSFKYFGTDRREGFLSRPFYTIRTSNMGKFLRGVLSLFPDLNGAYMQIEDRYWRKMFEIMSNESHSSDQQKVAEVAKKVKTMLSQGIDLTSDQGIEVLAQKVIALSKNMRRQSKVIPFGIFVDVAKAETFEYNSKNKATFEVDETRLKGNITELISSNIILAGINTGCPQCGDKNWYHIDDIKQRLSCRGCGAEFVVKAEQEWGYRLNNMVRDAFSMHGTIPVLLALGALFQESRSSFIYIPSFDLFIKKEDEQTPHLYSDLDIACIVDGKLVIGEVKQSIGLFDEKCFRTMGEIAELLRPDRVIFTSMDKPNKFVTDQIQMLKTKLEPLEITVEWYPFSNHLFEASPVRYWYSFFRCLFCLISSANHRQHGARPTCSEFFISLFRYKTKLTCFCYAQEPKLENSERKGEIKNLKVVWDSKRLHENEHFRSNNRGSRSVVNSSDYAE